MCISSTNEHPIKLNDEDIHVENITSFTYLGSVIAVDGGTAFLLLRPVCRSKEISVRTKLRIFNTNVKSV